MLSAAAATDHLFYSAVPQTPFASGGSAAPPAAAFTPQQIRQAYGINSITLGSLVGDGTGQTIAIIDAYDDPDFVDTGAANFAASDLHQFDAQFGLADPPSFVKLNQTGGVSLPGVDPSGPSNDDWEGEESLDVEWAHAVAPGASIILVEANSDNFNDLLAAVNTARSLSGVSVVSMSFGWDESYMAPLGSNAETAADATFTTPAGHQGVTFVAATGDDGYPGDYPAFSPNVLAAGGTSLYLSSGSYNYETAWSDSGYGTSNYETEPGYQASVQASGAREIADVSFDANPNTGVAIYDSYDFGSSKPWSTIGGTSLATPSWAGLVAIADQLRASQSLGSLDGASQTLPDLYALPQTDFHSPKSVSGYYEPTGRGSPIANKLVPDLAALADLGQTTTLNVAAAGTATYGGTVALSATLSSGGLGVSGQTVTFSIDGTTVGTAATNASGVATLATVSVDGLSVGTYSNYLAATFGGDTADESAIAFGNLTIGKAPLTVTAVNASKPYGAADPTFSVSGTGFAAGDGWSSLGGTLTFTTNEPASGYAPVGNYTLTPAGLTSTNYTITFVAGTLSVVAAPTTVAIAAQPSAPVYGQPLTLVATVSAVLPSTAAATGGTVTFYVDGVAHASPVALVGGTARLVDSALLLAGSYTITAAYSGDGLDFAASGSAAVINTVAGGGDGGDTGPATAAGPIYPMGVALDAAGDLFIADYANERVFEVVKATGNIVSVAGGGSDIITRSGNSISVGDGGPATAAGLYGPEAVAVDAAGDLFIADSGNNRIREVIAATGDIVTVAGNGTKGFSGDGGLATAAALDNPTDVVIDAAGNLFIADTGNNRIREVVKATGNIVTVAGDGTKGFSGDGELATAAALDGPTGVAVDAAGDLFIADSSNERVREVVKATGDITTIVGNNTYGYSGDGGPATAATLDYPDGLALDAAGDLFIVDFGNNRVREVVCTTGDIVTVAGSSSSGFNGDGGLATAAEIDYPEGVAVDSAGDLFIADFGNDRVREVAAPSTLVTVAPASPTIALADANGPYNSTAFAATATVAGVVSGVDNTPGATLEGVALTLDYQQLNANGSTAADLGSTAPTAAGSYAVVASFAGSADYAAASDRVAFTIALVPLTITAGSATKCFGAADPAFWVSYAGFAPGDSSAELNGTLAFTTNEPASGAAPVGSYQITPSGLTSSNYAITFVSGTLAVVPVTVGLFDPATSTFYLKNSDGSGLPDIVVPFQPTNDLCIPVAGDWTDSGVTRVGLYDPTTSTFYLANDNAAGSTWLTVVFQPTSDACTPVVGDWTGDGATTIGLYDPTTSTFYQRDTNTSGGADASFVFGPAGSGWLPVAGDWTDSGKTAVGLYNPAASVFYLRNTNAASAPDTAIAFGPAAGSAVPIAGDWYTSGATTIGLYNPQTSVFAMRNSNTAGAADVAFQFGPPGGDWTPLVGDWVGGGQAPVVAAAAPLAQPGSTATAQLQAVAPQTSSADAATPAIAAADALGPSLSSPVAVALNAASPGGPANFLPVSTSGTSVAASAVNVIPNTLDSRAVDQIDVPDVVEHQLGLIAALDDRGDASFDAADATLEAALGVNASLADRL